MTARVGMISALSFFIQLWAHFGKCARYQYADYCPFTTVLTFRVRVLASMVDSVARMVAIECFGGTGRSVKVH